MNYNKQQLNCVSAPLYILLMIFDMGLTLILFILLLAVIVTMIVRKIKKEKLVNEKSKKLLLAIFLLLIYGFFVLSIPKLSFGYFMNIYPLQLAILGVLILLNIKFIKMKKLGGAGIWSKVFLIISIIFIISSVTLTYFTLFKKERIKDNYSNYFSSDSGGFCGGSSEWY